MTDTTVSDTPETSLEESPVTNQVAAEQATSSDNTPEQEQNGLPDDVNALKNMVRTLRRENAAERVSAKTKAAEEARDGVVQDIGRALGLITDETPAPDAETLTAQLTAERDAAHTAQTHLAVYKAAHAAGANADQMLDSVSFLNSIKDLDASDADAIAAAVQTWAKAHPKATPAQAVGTNTIEHAAGSGEPTTPRTLEGAIARAYAR